MFPSKIYIKDPTAGNMNSLVYQEQIYEVIECKTDSVHPGSWNSWNLTEIREKLA